MESSEIQSAILLIHCPDRKGLVASVTEFLYDCLKTGMLHSSGCFRYGFV